MSNKQQDEEFVQAIKVLPLKDKLKAIALSHYRTQWLDAEELLNKKIDELKKQHFISILPFQKQSNQIIQGIRVPNQQELKDADQYLDQAEKLEKAAALTKEPLKDFWTKTLLNAPQVAEICAEEDLPILQHLVKVENEFDPNSLNFTIKFEFSNNEFFTDKVLEKKFIFDGTNGDCPIESTGSKINWKTGKNITKKIIKKKQRNKKTGASRMVDEEVDISSFFQFFRQTINESEEGGQQAKLQMDYEIAQSLVEEIIPGALDFYLGVQKDDKMEGERFDDDEDEDDMDEDEDEDDEDDEE